MLTDLQWEKVLLMKTEEVNTLRLKFHGKDAMTAVIDQIDCRQRTAKKLAHTLGQANRFFFPSVLAAEQSTSDCLAKFHASLCQPSDRVLDMTCGLGIDSFHMARRVTHVDAYDLKPENVECALYNASELGLSNIDIHCADSVDTLMNMSPDSYNVIFIDPARRGAHGKRLFALSECQPDVVSLLPRLLEVAPKVIIKASPMLDMSHSLAELHNVAEIIAVGDRRECKELLMVCRREKPLQTELGAITIDKNADFSRFMFSEQQERNSTPTYTIPEPDMFLYEPFPAVMKAGPFKLLSQKFAASTPAPNSHIYMNAHRLTDFPGNAYRIVAVFPFNKKGIKELTSSCKQADITARNFLMKPEEVARKLKIKQGGENRIFATRTDNNNSILILTNPAL